MPGEIVDRPARPGRGGSGSAHVRVYFDDDRPVRGAPLSSRSAALTARCRRRSAFLGIDQDIARGVPELVAEVLVALDAAEVEADVAAGRGERGKREAQGVGADIHSMPFGNCLRVASSIAGLQVFLHQCQLVRFSSRLSRSMPSIEVQRIEHVALGLGHLLALLVAESVRVHVDSRETARRP